ncbi:hypothetical protein ACQ0MK_19265 [Thalassospira lucentensis]|uniref:hypothetical protein n=1 Tax=Thalassospira lucentensis TaxID=168935 RepID=UPI003D2F131C
MFKHTFAAFAFLLGFVDTSAQAAPATIGSCYDTVKLGDIPPPALSRDLYVLVDQTMALDAKLQEESYQKIIQFLMPGDSVQVIGFSANAAGYYTEIILRGVIDARLPDDTRYAISKKILRQIDTCQKNQDSQVRTFTGKALLHAFSNATTDLPKTEILSNLSNVTKSVISQSGTPEKYMLIISDMMENSDLLSLYGAGKLEKLNAARELEKLETKVSFEDMDRTKVYVIGGGFLNDGKYRSSVALKSLENFWSLYFDQSNAELRQFGSPSLLGDIGQ